MILLLLAFLAVPSLVISTVGAALGVRRMPDAEERVAGWITGVFYGTVTGVIALFPAGYVLGNDAGLYPFLLGPVVGAVAAYFITRFMTSPTGKASNAAEAIVCDRFPCAERSPAVVSGMEQRFRFSLRSMVLATAWLALCLALSPFLSGGDFIAGSAWWLMLVSPFLGMAIEQKNLGFAGGLLGLGYLLLPA
jgi:hypothetical protein